MSAVDGATAGAPPTERLARVLLNLIGEPGDPRIAQVTAELGAVRAAEHLVAQRERDLGADLLADLKPRLATADAERELDRADRMGIRFVVPGDPEWPEQVEDLLDVEAVQERGEPPLGLWVRGPLRLDQLDRSVAVVGSRSSTSYGSDVAGEIGAALGRAGWTTISGAAYGIDQAAHWGALAAPGPTVAVLACGVDKAYPSANRDLLQRIAATGAVISEVPPGRAPMRIRFLARNRLIAALAQGSVIVEAAFRSGAINTANWTGRLNRHLLAVPGPVTSAQSEGVHELLRTGAAGVVTCGAHVLEVVAPMGQHLVTPPRGPERASDRLTVKERQVLDAVPVSHAAGIDSVATTAGLGLLEVRSALGRLETRGFVQKVPQGWRLDLDGRQ